MDTERTEPSENASVTRRAYAAVGMASLLGFVGCLSASTDEPETMTPNPTDDRAEAAHPAMDDTLYRLTTADDPAVFSERHGLEFDAGVVPVTLRLTNADVSPPTDYLETVGARYADRVNATVHIDNLLSVAEHESVAFVDRQRETHQQ